jgi:hypothetical protein
MTSLLAILLPDDVSRHLARTEARHLHVLAQTLQALVDFPVEFGNRDRQVNPTLEGVYGCDNGMGQ